MDRHIHCPRMPSSSMQLCFYVIFTHILGAISVLALSSAPLSRLRNMADCFFCELIFCHANGNFYREKIAPRDERFVPLECGISLCVYHIFKALLGNFGFIVFIRIWSTFQALTLSVQILLNFCPNTSEFNM